MLRKLMLAAAIGTMPIVAEAQTCTTYPYPLVNGANADATQVMADLAYVASCVSALIPTTSGSPSSPQGRLTLVSASPVMTSAQTGKTTIYYTPYSGAQIPLYNGAALVPAAFSEIQNLTTNGGAGGGPAAAGANSNYDLFVWNSSGTITLTRGPAWTSDATRGTGAGTSELQMVSGTYTNKNAITNGPGANRGTYVGTIRTDGTNQVNWQPGGIASGGTAAILGVWNAYNRVDATGFIGDSNDSWNYTLSVWRPADNSTAMRVSFIQGLQEDALQASYLAPAANNVSGSYISGVGVDSTTVPTGGIALAGSANGATGLSAATAQLLGFHFMQALEFSQAAGSTTWFGDNGSGVMPAQNGILYRGRF